MCLVFVSGAVRSGKSSWAETYARTYADEHACNLVYIATANADDLEMLRRVELHKAARKGKGFETLEQHTDVGRLTTKLPLRNYSVLLECLGTLLANEMFGTGKAGTPNLAPQSFYVQKIFGDVLSLRAHFACIVVVSNDIFSDGVTYDEPMERYRQALGALHVELANAADLVVECVAGQAIVHKAIK